MGAGCRTLGNAPVRARTPIRQHAPTALSDPSMGVGVCCWFVKAVAKRPGVPIGLPNSVLRTDEMSLEHFWR
eukprot:7730951-Pyramimonas_sp.AAC.1